MNFLLTALRYYPQLTHPDEMSAGILKGPILMEGFGRVNLPNFLWGSEVVRCTCSSSDSSPIHEPVLAPSRSFLLLLSLD
jgi:hypothetical protein